MTLTEIMFVLTAIATGIYAVTTIIITRYTKRNIELAESIRKSTEAERERNEDFRKQMRDLLEAIVISRLCGPGTHSFDSAFQCFKRNYKGETKILRDS